MKSEFDLERMERICRIYASNQAAAQALLGYVAEMTDPQACSFLAAIQDGSIGHVLNLIHQYISRNWTLNELAEVAGMSRSVFTERFRSIVGASPMVYVAQWRMLKARELLLDTSLSVAQVAAAIGYESEFSFAKAFKKLYDTSPGRIRNSA